MTSRVASRRNAQQASATPSAGAKRSGPHVSEIAEQDSKRVCAPDLHRPFTNIDDVVDRLLPYHILASEDAGEADRREAEEAGLPLAASRWDTWRAFAAKRANELESKRLALVDRIAKVEKSALENSEIVRLALHTYAAAEAERDVEAEKRRQVAAKVAAAEAHARAMAEAARAVEMQRVAAAAAMQARAAEAELNRHAAAQAMAAQAALAQQQAASTGVPVAPVAPAVPAAAQVPPAAAPAALAAPAAPVAAAPAPPPAPIVKKADPKSNVIAKYGNFGKKKK